MRKYLTSKGSTYSLDEYLEDALMTRLLADFNCIPKLNYGLDKVVVGLKNNEAESLINTRLNVLITNFNTENGVNLIVESIKINKSKINIIIDNSGNSKNYEIIRSV